MRGVAGMRAYKCDRCGRYYERDYKPNVTVVHRTYGAPDEYIDLCRECSIELIKWCRLKNEEKLIKEVIKTTVEEE